MGCIEAHEGTPPKSPPGVPESPDCPLSKATTCEVALQVAVQGADNHQIREGIIGFSPASPPIGETSKRCAGCNLDITRCSDRLAIYSLRPYKQGNL